MTANLPYNMSVLNNEPWQNVLQHQHNSYQSLFYQRAIYSLEENICFDISLIVNKVQFRAIETWEKLVLY